MQTFEEIKKYNHYHGADGRFTTSSGNVTGSFSFGGDTDSGGIGISAGVKKYGFDKNDGTACSSDVTHPNKVSGVERGKPMTFEEADTQKSNPGFENNHNRQTNCQTCVVAYEMRRRGYNVEAKPYTGMDYDQKALASDPTHVWIDPKTGRKPNLTHSPETFRSSDEAISYLQSTLKKGKRYALRLNWANDGGGHIIIAQQSHGRTWLFDPQSGDSYVEADEVKSVVERLAGVGNNKRSKGMSGGALKLLPISDMNIDPFAVETSLTRATT